MIIPIFFILLTQPLTMRLLLTLQTIVIRIAIYIVTKNIWMSLTLVLVIVGGLMISFVYVSSLIPAEPYSRTLIWLSPIVIIPFITICFKPTQFQLPFSFVEFTPIDLYNNTTFSATIIVITILIITLLVICSNTLQVKSPMRSYR